VRWNSCKRRRRAASFATSMLVLCTGAAVSPAAEPPPRVNETVSGWSFRAIEAAVTELKRHGLNAIQ
jgi:hypothetical protein